jgi:tRNA G18 (ribose-2'-O)-methylase SpoU
MESPPVILAAGTSQALCSTVSEMSNLNSVLTKEELRADKPDRTTFLSHPRRPIRVILDNVVGNYNIGAVFRLCDALLIERLIISGPEFTIRKRRITQAAQGAQNWVLWEHIVSVEQAVSDAREAGFQIVAVELTSTSIAPASYIPRFPVCVVIGNERSGVSPSVVAVADVTLAIPMRGMSNSLNLATAAAIILYEIDKHIIEAAHV